MKGIFFPLVLWQLAYEVIALPGVIAIATFVY